MRYTGRYDPDWGSKHRFEQRREKRALARQAKDRIRMPRPPRVTYLYDHVRLDWYDLDGRVTHSTWHFTD